jgi:hypothetical protein
VPLPSMFLKSCSQEFAALVAGDTVAGMLAALPALIGRAEDNETVLTSVIQLSCTDWRSSSFRSPAMLLAGGCEGRTSASKACLVARLVPRSCPG